jgi:predicted nucleotidyltransferase
MVDASVMEKVHEEIQKIEEEKNISVILCVEAGSRAWGIPSVDSDYDVRFVYVHNDLKKYISFTPKPEEEYTEQIENLDIKGYDIRKAYELIYKGEVNVYEWLASDIVYKEDKERRWLIDKAAKENFDMGSVARCYYGMAKRIYINDMRWIDQVKVKKYIYCLRSILCCRYILENNEPVPLKIDLLLDKMPGEYQEELRSLLKLKVETVDNTRTKRSYALEDKVLEEIGKLEVMLRGRWANQNKKPDQMDSLLLSYIKGM